MANIKTKNISPVSIALIDEDHVEIQWPVEMTGADSVNAYALNYHGASMPLFQWDESMEWQRGTLYEGGKRRSTISPIRPVPVSDFDELTLSFEASLAALDGTPTSGKEFPVRYEPYYTHFQRSGSGILIKSGNDTSQVARDKAGAIIDVMLRKLSEEARVMANFGVELCVYGPDEDAFDVPEHRMGYNIAPYPVAGYGACEGNAITSISQLNLLRVVDGEPATHYRNESILAHEFAHGIHLIGLKFVGGGERYQRFESLYESSKEAGLWPNTYAISNVEEFFATLTTIWFDVMEESPDGSWNIRGPVNTREELLEYDPKTYAFMDEIYPACHLPAPWDCGLDRFDIKGNPRQNATN